METPNILPSTRAPIVAAVFPHASPAGVQSPPTLQTAYVGLDEVGSVLARVLYGVIGAGQIVGASLLQATDAEGTGEKAITGKASTLAPVGAASPSEDNGLLEINCRSDELDVNNGFCFVKLVVTVTDGSPVPSPAESTPLAAWIEVFDHRYPPTSIAAETIE
jgi:hypothetical protein